jgi:hypothetical protein
VVKVVVDVALLVEEDSAIVILDPVILDLLTLAVALDVVTLAVVVLDPVVLDVM